MKTIYGIFILVGMVMAGMACHEDSLEPEFKYTGPIPEIVDGPAEGQKICYELYQKYDLHVYYTLSGDEALRTEIGSAQVNAMTYDPAAFPIQVGDEVITTAFLKFLKKFYDLLPEEMAKTSGLRRNVLVKVNLGDDYYSSDFNFYKNCHTETMQGIVFWGDMDDEIGIKPDVWKYSLSFSFFEAIASNYYHPNLPNPTEFASVAPYYEEMSKEEKAEADTVMVDEETEVTNMEYMFSKGFVDPHGFMMATAKNSPYVDMATYVAWIVCKPLAERQEIMGNNPLVKRKYELTLKYYKENFKLDLEDFAQKLSIIKIE